MAPGEDITDGPWEDEEAEIILIGGGIDSRWPPGLIERYLATRQQIIDAGYTVAAGQDDDVLQGLALKQCQETMHILSYRDNREVSECAIKQNNSWQQMNRGKMSKKQRRK